MKKQPLLIAVICFIIGIFFQDFFNLEKDGIIGIVVLIIFLSCLFYVKNTFLFKIRNLVFVILFFFIGVSVHYFNSNHFQKTNVKTNSTIVFKLSKKLNSNEKYKKYEVLAEAENQSFEAIVNVDKSWGDLDFNHYYQAKAYIVQPKKPEHNFQFDYQKYLSRNNIFYLCYINGEISSAKRQDLSFDEKIKQKRLDVLQRINQSEMSVKSREFLKGIILADRTEMDAETVQDFNRSGLVHFLAISGTHIVVIFGIFYFLLARFSPIYIRKYAIVSSLVFIWIFAFFIGFGSSVVRSCIMLSVYFGYVILQRKPDLLHSLALSAWIILLIDTQQIFDVGFQLSFLAVWGIYWLNQPILKYFPKPTNYVKKLLFNTVSISLSAQIATLPLVLYYFHQFSLVSTIANFAIVPFSEIIIVFSFVMTGLFAVNIEFGFLDFMYDELIKILLKVIHWFADFDAVFFENISFSIVEVLFFFIIIYSLRFLLEKCNLKNIYRFAFTIFLFLSVKISFDVYENYRNEVLVFNYKKTSVIAVKNGGNALLIMSKSKDEENIRKFIVNPYISSRRINHYQIKYVSDSVKTVKIDKDKYPTK